MNIRNAPTIEDAFRARTTPAGDGHLKWAGYRNGSGAPQFSYDGKIRSALRVAFRIRTGRWPDGIVKAECDMRGCVAPEHVDDTATRSRDRAALAALTGRWHSGECRRGHDQSVHGKFRPDGRHYCSTCAVERRRERRATAAAVAELTAEGAR